MDKELIRKMRYFIFDQTGDWYVYMYYSDDDIIDFMKTKYPYQYYAIIKGYGKKEDDNELDKPKYLVVLCSVCNEPYTIDNPSKFITYDHFQCSYCKQITFITDEFKKYVLDNRKL
jgi:hypothetical protein